MSVNALTGINTGASAQLQRTASRIQSSIANLVGGSKTQSLFSTTDLTGLSSLAQMQSQLSTLKTVSSNVAGAMSLSQVAENGIDRESQLVQQLQSLAASADSESLDASGRQSLNLQFQGLVQELNRISQNTQFGGKNLLDGSFSLNLDQTLGNADGEDDSATLNIGDLSAGGLFKGQALSLLTPGGAAAATSALSGAADTLKDARGNIEDFTQSLDYTAATLQSAVFNQNAAHSTLAEDDFNSSIASLLTQSLQQNPQLATAVQSAKLPASVLDLLNS